MNMQMCVGQEEVRGEEVERRGSVGLGHRRRQLRHLPKPHHGSLHRMPGQSGAISLICRKSRTL